MNPPGKTGRSSELNNTANAGRIVRSRNGRKILPAFLLTILSRHLPPPRYRRKRKSAEITSMQIRKKNLCKKPLGRYGRKIVKGEASSRPVCRSQSAAPVIRGIAHPSDPSPGGSQDTGGAFRSRVQRHGVRHRSIGAGHICPMWQRTDLAQVKRDRHTGKPRKARNTKAFRLRQSISFAEMRRKRLSLPMGEVRPAEHNFEYKELSLYDHKRQLPHPRYPVGQAGAA